MSVARQQDLAGQTALVTGASRGIGRAIAVELAERGAWVGVNFVSNEAAAEEALAEIHAVGGAGELVPFDVGSGKAAGDAVRAFAKARGSLEILVNNAGIARDGLVLRYKSEDWEKILAVNLSGAFACSKAAARSMMRARYGRIVNVTSVVASMGNAGQVAYAATKAGLEGMTRSMAREFASRAITVNAVAPGLIDTEMTLALPEEARAAYLLGIPLGRLGTTQEVARAVGFLAGKDSGYITGHVLAVNGGMYV